MFTPNRIGTPLSPSATTMMLLGSGELGKEMAIAFQRLGVEVHAVDSYENAPAHQVAHAHYVIDMTNPDELRRLIAEVKPQFIVPEIEAVDTNVLDDCEAHGVTVIPTARATQLTMNREGIRRLAAEELGLPTSAYSFASNPLEFKQAVAAMGFPCVVKPVMSSSGKGQSIVRDDDDIATAWDYAQSGGRVEGGRVIVERFVDFDYEITLLTVRSIDPRSLVLRTHRAPPTRRRLRGILAAHTHAQHCLGKCPLRRRPHHQRPRWARTLRRGTVRLR